MLVLKADTSSGNFSEALALNVQNSIGTSVAAIHADDGGFFSSGASQFTNLNVTNFTHSGGANSLGFYGTGGQSKQVSGANLTNNVTVGGVNDTIADFTSLTVYATDAAAIRNDIYQLARKLKQINDGLRAYGLFT